MSAAAAAIGPAWWSMAQAAWQQRRHAGSMRWVVATALLLLALPIVLGLLVAPAQGRAAAVACWTVAVVGPWMTLALGLMRQNHPHLARLVPGHLARMRALLSTSWVAASLLVSAAWVLGPGTQAALATACVATALFAVALALRWPLLWAVWGALGFVAGSAAVWAGGHPKLHHAVQEMASLVQHHALPLALAMLALGAFALPRLLHDGGARHEAAYRARERWLRSLWERSQFDCWGSGMPRGLQALLRAPYQARLARHAGRAGGDVMSRAMLLLGPSVHWTGGLGQVLFVATVVGLPIILFFHLFHLRPVSEGTVLGLAIAFTQIALGTVHQLRVTLHQTRHEQALLALLPGMPRGSAFNRRLGRALALHAGAALLANALLLALLARGLHANGASTLAMPLGALPWLVLLWRDWSRSAKPSPSAAVALSVGGALGGLALLGLQGMGATLPMLLAIATGATLAAGVWRWRRAEAAAQAWPTGRWG
jgi:hypothetical protein